jgi:hypothetical protein
MRFGNPGEFPGIKTNEITGAGSYFRITRNRE